MSLSDSALQAELHLVYRVANTPVLPYPFPHIYVTEAFPPDYYRAMLEHLPPSESYTAISEARPVSKEYGETRKVIELRPSAVQTLPASCREFWDDFARMLLRGNFGQTVLGKFEPIVRERFKDSANIEFFDEAMLVQDLPKYALGPHTDTPMKVLSTLFYLPKDESRPDLGTSLYVPKDSNFTCPGGPHYAFDAFMRMFTMPYVPNALFAFVKTPNAFHGVEPVQEQLQRQLLFYDVRLKNAPRQPGADQAARAANAGPGKFSF
jgi:hypothetical protein